MTPRLMLFLALLLPAPACGGASGPAPAAPQTPSTGPSAAANQPATGAPPAAVDAAERGATLFGQHCARCHGDHGQGQGKAPPLVGAAALPLEPRPGAARQVEFATALDVAGWVQQHMPPDAPGSLSQADYLAIVAFDLQANGVDLAGKSLDQATLAQIRLH